MRAFIFKRIRGVQRKPFPAPAAVQVPTAPNNPYANAAYFGETHFAPFSSWASLCPGHCWPSLDVQRVGKGGLGVLVTPQYRHGSRNARSDNHFVRLSSNQGPRSLRVRVQEEFPRGAEALKGVKVSACRSSSSRWSPQAWGCACDPPTALSAPLW